MEVHKRFFVFLSHDNCFLSEAVARLAPRHGSASKISLRTSVDLGTRGRVWPGPVGKEFDSFNKEIY
jgi:hypothetical protein